MHKLQVTSSQSQNAPFNKSLNEATSSMTHLSTSARHEATIGGSDKNSDEKRIEVRTFKSVMGHSARNTESLTRSASVITSSNSSLSFSSHNNMDENIGSIGNHSYVFQYQLIT